jgi:hypothetical protein
MFISTKQNLAENYHRQWPLIFPRKGALGWHIKAGLLKPYSTNELWQTLHSVFSKGLRNASERTN